MEIRIYELIFCCYALQKLSNMGKPRDDVRTLFEERKDKSVDCKYCKAKYRFINVTKMKNHILKCMKCPNDVKAKYKTSFSHSNSSIVSLASSSSTSIPRQQEMQEYGTPTRTRLTEVKQFVDSMNPTENVSSFTIIPQINTLMLLLLFVLGKFE